MSKTQTVKIERGILNTSATVARSFITASVAEYPRNEEKAIEYIEAAIDELLHIRGTIILNQE